MNKFQRALISGTDPKVNAQLERFGVEGYSHGRTDRGSNYRSAKDVQDDLIEAARNDYDLRRTLEASAMSGKKKANKILDKGFTSIGDINNATNFQAKAAKRHGQGGQFSSAKDMMGLTQSMVERDRNKLMEDIKAKTKAATPELPPAPPPEAQFTITEEEDAANDAARDERISDYEAGRASGENYMDNYKFNVKKGLKSAGVDTRGSQAPSFIF